jgi:hypothetical protein
MNESPTPLDPEVVDELLTAEIDGEVAGAADDLGLTAHDALARLAATPGVDERRAALVHARDLLATPPDLDELLKQRLVAKAVRASEQAGVAHRRASRERHRSIWVAAGSVAAAVLVVVGLATALARRDTAGNDTLSADSTESTESGASGDDTASDADAAAPGAGSSALDRATTPTTVDLGEVSDPAVLRDKIVAALPPATTRNSTQELSPSTLAESQASSEAPRSPTSPDPGCRERAAGLAPTAPTSAPVLTAKGTVDGRTVEIFVFDVPEGGRAVVVMSGDCGLLNHQTLN